MKSPIFVLGAPRSSTTLLYHMLVSSGRFANYRAETHVFNLLGPKFGNLDRPAHRRRLLDAWLGSFQFRRSGLDPWEFVERAENGFSTTGEFLRVFMQEICASQGIGRWAECTPEHLLYMRQIKRELPDVKFIHIIRDGRDVALSEVRQGWVKTLPWDSKHQLAVSGLYWEWIVRKGREQGRSLGEDYMEVRFEELVQNPRIVLPGIGDFIGQTLDYDFLLENAVGSLREPNTSFDSATKFAPIGRWKTKLESHELQPLESAIRPLLRELRYPTTSEGSHGNYTTRRLRACYPLYFTSRWWLKSRTPLGRLTNLGLLYDYEPATVHDTSPQAMTDNAYAAGTAEHGAADKPASSPTASASRRE